MPDFEALIKHQQLKQPSAKKRLEIVDNKTKQFESKKNLQFFSYFFIGLIGGIVGSISIFFLGINELIPLDILKIF